MYLIFTLDSLENLVTTTFWSSVQTQKLWDQNVLLVLCDIQSITLKYTERERC